MDESSTYCQYMSKKIKNLYILEECVEKALIFAHII